MHLEESTCASQHVRQPFEPCPLCSYGSNDTHRSRCQRRSKCCLENSDEASEGPCIWYPNKKRATFLRSLRLPGESFAIDLAKHFTGSPKSARFWERYDNLMTQLLYLVASVASNGTSVSLNGSSLSSSLNPGVANGFTLLPSSHRSLPPRVRGTGMEASCSAVRCWTGAGDKIVGTSINCSTTCGSLRTAREGHEDEEIMGTSETCSATGRSRRRENSNA